MGEYGSGFGITKSGGTGSGGTITGSGTTNTIPIFTGATALGDSTIVYDGESFDIGSTVTTFEVGTQYFKFVNANLSQIRVVQGNNTNRGEITFGQQGFGGAGITANREWNLPDASGTVALTSDIPTISGTTNTIPIFTSATAIGDSLLTYNGESFLFSLVGGTVAVDNANGRITLDPNTPAIVFNDKSDGFAGSILIDTMTANREWTFPDATGTVALTSDISALRNVTATATFVTPNETINCTANTFTVNLPTAVGIQGTVYTLVNSGTGTITLDPSGTETINGNLTIDLVQYVSRTVQSDGTNWIII